MFPNTFRTKTQISRKRRGAAIVEMAFVVIILLVLTLGLIQWGLIFNTSISITNLSREAARFAAVHAKDGDDTPIVNYITGNLPPGIAKEDLTILIDPPVGSPLRTGGRPVHVTLEYNMARKLFLPNKMFAEPYTITFFNGIYRAQGRMMIEG